MAAASTVLGPRFLAVFIPTKEVENRVRFRPGGMRFRASVWDWVTERNPPEASREVTRSTTDKQIPRGTQIAFLTDFGGSTGKKTAWLKNENKKQLPRLPECRGNKFQTCNQLGRHLACIGFRQPSLGWLYGGAVYPEILKLSSRIGWRRLRSKAGGNFTLFHRSRTSTLM